MPQIAAIFYVLALVMVAVLSYFIDSMNIKQTIIQICLVLGLTLGVASFVAQPVSAASDCKDADYRNKNADKCCGEVNVSILSCKDVNNSEVETSGVWKMLLLALNIMTAGVGVLAVGGIVYGSILYTSAGDKAEQTKKAIGIITNVVIGIIAYALMYLVLNFLIPGGVFA